MATAISRQDARRLYDRIGSLQDSQAFYEDRATTELANHADFGSARAVFEFGCGTGRYALRLLTELLPTSARYRGVDISPRMVSLARARLEAHASRAEVILTEGGPPSDEPSESCDRFVSNYVLDLLSDDDIRGVLREARRMLQPGGHLCLTSLSTGVGPLSRTIATIWSRVQARRPSLVGGCRPIELLAFLPGSDWEVRHRTRIVSFGIPSEVLVASRR